MTLYRLYAFDGESGIEVPYPAPREAAVAWAEGLWSALPEDRRRRFSQPGAWFRLDDMDAGGTVWTHPEAGEWEIEDIGEDE